jgi:Flp pilus assembly pilin Flp
MLSKLFVRVLAWFHREEGQDLVEYALITFAISLAIVLAVVGTLTGAFETWAGNLSDEITGVVS